MRSPAKTAQELYNAFVDECGGYICCSESVVMDVIAENEYLFTLKSLDGQIDRVKDAVLSQGLCEEVIL